MMLDEVLDLLGQRWDRIHGAQALKLLPKETKLQVLYFLDYVQFISQYPIICHMFPDDLKIFPNFCILVWRLAKLQKPFWKTLICQELHVYMYHCLNEQILLCSLPSSFW